MLRPQCRDSRDPRPADNRSPALRERAAPQREQQQRSSALSSQRALELDGQQHHYSAEEWLPAVYDIAALLLEAARLDREPPSLVEQAQEAVRWLSRAIVDLDEDSPDAAAAIVDGLGRMLALHVFADVARTPADELGT